MTGAHAVLLSLGLRLAAGFFVEAQAKNAEAGLVFSPVASITLGTGTHIFVEDCDRVVERFQRKVWAVATLDNLCEIKYRWRPFLSQRPLPPTD